MNVGHLLFAAATMMFITALAVGLSQRLRLGSIIGLLLVGIVLGPHSPWSLFTGQVEEMRAIGEVGVMLLLFVTGLDMQPGRLWSMRGTVLGLGSLQYGLSVAAIVLFLLVAIPGVPWRAALVVALALAMSSAAVPLPILRERREEATAQGRTVVAVEVFQALLIVPVLALIPLLDAGPAAAAPVPAALRIAAALGVLAGIYVLGRFLLPWALTLAARGLGSGGFAVIVLSAVFFAAWAADLVGISMALGTFMTGVLLSTSVYAEQVKAAVTPARQLFLALFFIAIGMAIDLKQLAALSGQVFFYLPALLLIKFAVLLALGRLFRLQSRAALLAALLLMPFDEIAYVILASATGHGLVSSRGYAISLCVLSFSFVASPILINLGYRWSARWASSARPAEAGKLPRVEGRVVILGCGDVGRAICSLLERAAVDCQAFDDDLAQIAKARRAGHSVLYGDLGDPALMDAVAIGQARLVIIATGLEPARRMAANLRHFYPRVPVMTAVPYLAQRDELQRLGAAQVTALMPEGVMSFGLHVLERLGLEPARAGAVVAAVKAGDYAALRGNLDPAQPAGQQQI